MTPGFSRPALPAWVTAGALLLFVPGRDSAFLEPKAAVLAGGAFGAMLLTATRWRGWWWPGLLMAAVVTALAWAAGSLEAPVTLVLVSGAVAMGVWPALGPERDLTRAVLWLPLSLVAGLTLLQAVGVDPLQALGAQATGRLRLAATLGNPDFVASALGALVWLVLPQRGADRGRWVAMVLIGGALAVTRSFATVLALGAAALFVGLHAKRRAAVALCAGVTCAALLVTAGATRSLERSVRGRLYLHAVALRGLEETGLRGGGPGVVELRWPSWEADWWTARCGEDPACVERDEDARFVGLQSRVHDDWLELLLELGLVGFLLLGAVVVLALRAAWRAETFHAGAVLVSVLARALVDFPLHRAADLAVLALSVSLLVTRGAPAKELT